MFNWTREGERESIFLFFYSTSPPLPEGKKKKKETSSGGVARERGVTTLVSNSNMVRGSFFLFCFVN